MAELTVSVEFFASGSRQSAEFRRERYPDARRDAAAARQLLAELYRDAREWVDAHVEREAATRS